MEMSVRRVWISYEYKSAVKKHRNTTFAMKSSHTVRILVPRTPERSTDRV